MWRTDTSIPDPKKTCLNNTFVVYSFHSALTKAKKKHLLKSLKCEHFPYTVFPSSSTQNAIRYERGILPLQYEMWKKWLLFVGICFVFFLLKQVEVKIHEIFLHKISSFNTFYMLLF